MERGPISASKLHPKKIWAKKNNRKIHPKKIYFWKNFISEKKIRVQKYFFSKLRFFSDFFSKLRFFSEMSFSKIFFFFGWIFSTIFFSLRIFWGCSFEAENGPLSIYGVFRAIAALLRPVWSKLVVCAFFQQTFGQCELRKFLVYTKCYLLPKIWKIFKIFNFSKTYFSEFSKVSKFPMIFFKHLQIF